MKNQRHFFKGVRLGIALAQLLWLPQLAQTKTLGADPPKCAPRAGCVSCACPSLAERSDTTTSVSRTEGNLTEWINVASVQSAFGPTLSLTAIYNSYNADGSRATVNTVMGNGWTHSFNVFLFSQVGSMFLFDAGGRITRFALGSSGAFTAAAGYFETLVKNVDGSYTMTQKDKTTFTFKSIAGTLFQVGGPVWRLTSIVDRNGNTTTLTYTGGNLTTVADTYGRTLTFTYNPVGHVTSVADPRGRTTTFQYDSTGQMLTNVTDPNGNSIRYTYNPLFQMTSKVDKAGRTFTYSYSALEPTSVQDSSNTSPAVLSNPGNWATNQATLAASQIRAYTPATTTNTDGRGNLWKYQYDTNGYILQTTAPDGSTTSYTYDPVTLQTATKTDANGHTTSYTYNSMGDMLSMTDPLTHVTTYTYESSYNMMTSMTDPQGRITTYTIDPATGNRTRETDPLGQSNQWTYDSHGNVLSFTDKNGNTTTYQYDSTGDRIKTVDALGNTTNMTYDSVGNLISLTDANGHTTTYQYDGLNRLLVTTDPTGHTDQTIYDGEGNRTQTIDRDGHATTYQYDVRQRLITKTDPLGHTDRYTYDGNDNRASWTDRDGHTTSYQYDVQNRLITATDALGNVTSATYDPVGNTSTQTDANGHTTTYTYDALNRRITMKDALNEQTNYYYDGGTFSGSVNGITCTSCGATLGSRLVTEQIDPDGTSGSHAGATYYKYDALDRLIIKVRKTGCIGSACPDTITANDAVTTYTYDAVGNRLTFTEPDGNATTYRYDTVNRLTTETNAAGDVTTTAYDGVGNVITITDPNLNVTTDAYDSLNRLIQASDSVGAVSSLTYDPVGNRLTLADGDGNTTSYGYDALNRTVTETDALGKTTTTQYDAVGNVLKSTDRNGNITTYTYDAINRRLTTTDALGDVTQVQYDPVGNMIKLTDANSHATQYAYDAVNRPQKETYADGLYRSYTYDATGNLLTRIDQIGQTTTYNYSDLYFLVSRAYPVTGTDTFTYDLSGRMLIAVRGSWPVAFTYDGADRVTRSTQNGQAVAYVYNIPGRSRQITYPGGRSITEYTDARMRMDHIVDGAAPSQSIVQYAYDLADNVLSRNYLNGTTSAFSYNADNWTTNIAHSNPSIFAQFGYGYDNEGHRLYENKTPQDPAQSEAYQYDATYRLTNYQVGTLSGATIPVPVTQTSYTLDAVGNWNTKTTDSVTQTRTHNVDNELTEIDSTGITYDSNGNTLSDGTYTYAYDEENRLITVTNGASEIAAQYQYDALGRRVQKLSDPNGTPSTTVYYYDGARVLQEQNSLAISAATYVYGNYVDEVLTMNLGGNIYYYHQNASWSVEAITDGSGTPQERYAYDAYGAVTVTNGLGVPVPLNSWGTPHSAIGNPYIFTGQRLDEETGIFFYRARYYDTMKGRFLQRDPLEYVDGMNLYWYVQDDPTNALDATGMACILSQKAKAGQVNGIAEANGCGEVQYTVSDKQAEKLDDDKDKNEEMGARACGQVYKCETSGGPKCDMFAGPNGRAAGAGIAPQDVGLVGDQPEKDGRTWFTSACCCLCKAAANPPADPPAAVAPAPGGDGGKDNGGGNKPGGAPGGGNQGGNQGAKPNNGGGNNNPKPDNAKPNNGAANKPKPDNGNNKDKEKDKPGNGPNGRGNADAKAPGGNKPPKVAPPPPPKKIEKKKKP